MAQVKLWKQGTPLTLLAIVDDYESFVFTRHLTGVGIWSLTLDANSPNQQLIRDADFVSAGKGKAGLIKKIEGGTAEGEKLTLSGVELKGLAYNRIVIPAENYAYLSFNNKTAEYIIAELLNTQLINPADSKRRIINSKLNAYTQKVTGLRKSYRYKNVGEMIEELATTYNIGWYADIQNGNIEFNIFHGVDRKNTQSVNEPLVVSYERDAIEHSSFAANKGTPKTALVAGRGDGAYRSTVIVGNSDSDIVRNEIYVDARDIEDEIDLPARGYQKLAEHSGTHTYHVRLNQHLAAKYGDSFDLGDEGTVQDSILNQQVHLLLTEITEAFEVEGYVVDVVFGYDLRTLRKYFVGMRQETENLQVRDYVEIDDVENVVGELENTITITFRDGVISEAEAKAIEKYKNLLESEKGDLDTRFTAVYNDTNLIGTPKTNLNSKKTAYNTAHSNLMAAINTAIADGTTTVAEKQNVDSKFATYKTALSELANAFEAAAAYISTKKAADAEAAAKTYTDGKVITLNSDIGNKSSIYRGTYAQMIAKTGMKVGDIWIATNENNREYQAIGTTAGQSSWVLVSVGKFTGATVDIDAESGLVNIAAGKKLSVVSGGLLELAGESRLTIGSQGEIDLSSGGKLKIKSVGSTTLNTVEMNSGGIAVSSSGKLDMAGSNINVTSGGKINLEGPDGIVFSTGVGLETTVKNQLGQTAIVEFEKGTILDEYNTTTAVTLKVYHNGVDVTELIPETAVKWYLREAEDNTWTLKAANTKSVTLVSADVDFRSVLRCSIDTVELLVSAWVENGELYIEDNALGGESALFSLIEGELLYAGSSDYYGQENKLNASLTIGSFVIDTQLSNLATSYISIKRDAIDIKSGGLLKVKANGAINIEADGKINLTTPAGLMVSSTKTLAAYTSEEILSGVTAEKVWRQVNPPTTGGGFTLVAGTLWLNTAATTHAATGITSGSLARYTGTSWIPVVAGEVRTSKITVGPDEINIASGGNLKLAAPNDLSITAGTGTSAVGLANGKYANGTTNGGYFLYAGNSNPAAAPFSVKMDGTITNVGNAYTQTAVDNASNTNGVKMDVFFPDDVSAVDKCYLSVKFSAFRAYSTGAASGGGQTSGAGGAQTSSTATQKEYTSAVSATTTTENSTTNTSIPSIEDQANTDGPSKTSTGGPSVGNVSDVLAQSGLPHNHAMQAHTHGLNNHTHNMAHYHLLPQHTHGLNSHQHTVTIDSHSHTIDNHTHTVNNHTHNITYGIYEGTTPTSCSVYVDGTLVPALSGVAAFTSHDIANYFSKIGGKITRNTFHTVEIRPNTALGRISAHLYIKTTQISKVAGNL